MKRSTQREWIENARQATGARTVRLGRMPQWARQAIRRAHRKEDTRPRRYLDTILNQERWGGLFDHWGTSSIPQRNGPDEPTFCTEPYAGRRQIEAALRFADWLECDVEIGGASWWYPGATVRIEFREPGKGEQPAVHVIPRREDLC